MIASLATTSVLLIKTKNHLRFLHLALKYNKPNNNIQFQVSIFLKAISPTESPVCQAYHTWAASLALT